MNRRQRPVSSVRSTKSRGLKLHELVESVLRKEIWAAGPRKLVNGEELEKQDMSMESIKDIFERFVSVFEAAQFKNGSLDVTLQGPESEWVGSPVKMIVDLRGDAAKELAAEVSGVAVALAEIASAIREAKK